MSGERGRRAEILEAALSCFLENGYDATTLQDIRKRSGASIGSIYHAFSGKDEIAAVLLMETVGDWQRTLLARLAPEESAEGVVRAAVEAFVDWVAHSPDRARYLFHAPRARLDTAASAEIKAQNAELVRALRAKFKPHIASHALRELPMSLFIPVLIGPAMEWARQWLGGRSPNGPAEARPVLSDVGWAAMRAP